MKICFFDLDGTILTDEKTISCRTQKTLSQLHDIGVLIGYITARTKRKIGSLIKGLPCDFIASYDGAFIECFSDNNATEVILNECINDDVAHQLIRQLLSLKNVDVFSYFEPYYLYNDKISCFGDETIFDYNAKTATILSGCQRIRGRSKDSVSVFSDFEKHQNIYSYKENCDIVFRSKNVSKGLATCCILKHYGLGYMDAIAFGDTEPDIDMFNQCHISVAMGNATCKTKENATFVTLSNNEDGVSEAIDRIFRLR